MNVYDIKNKANEVLRQPTQLFKVILYVGIIQALFLISYTFISFTIL